MKRPLILAALALLIPVLILISLSVGAFHLGFTEVLKILLNVQSNPDPVAQAIVWNIRLPRTLMALIAGIVLALAGVALQGALKNPLVSTTTIGLSSGASFGAALAIIMGVGFVGFGPCLIMANAFLFGFIAAAAALGIARLKGMAAESVILAGIAMAYLFSALVTLLQYVSRHWDLKAFVLWLMGDLVLANWTRVSLATLSLIVCIPLFKYAWDLNTLMMGEEVAKSLGTNPGRTRLACMTLAALAASIVVCLVGPIGFICLVAPHMARFLVGADHRFSMIGSALLGGVLLLSADSTARVVMVPYELPVGVVTAFLGIPSFIYLLLRTRRELWA